jgi:GDP-mannose pyrophosphatase NudK
MNPDIEILKTETLSDNWYRLDKITFRQRDAGGDWSIQSREAYDRGNGATILLYNLEQQTVILTRQFRMPTYINGNDDGMLIETCAGLLDGENPLDAIKRETEEETGYRLGDVQKVFDLYMSPGSVTEIVHFFITPYSQRDKISAGGGTGADERIEVMEIPFQQAMAMIRDGRIKDGKTVILLQHLHLSGMFSGDGF